VHIFNIFNQKFARTGGESRTLFADVTAPFALLQPPALRRQCGQKSVIIMRLFPQRFDGYLQLFLSLLPETSSPIPRL
jgi:hypothetical protein